MMYVAAILSIRELVDSLCRDNTDKPMPPYIQKACNRPNTAFVSLFPRTQYVCAYMRTGTGYGEISPHATVKAKKISETSIKINTRRHHEEK